MAQRNFFSAGYSYSTYVCNNKTVQTWGDNYYGQLARTAADGALTVPATIRNVTDIISIDAGLGSFCCALTSTGHVLSWGHNFFGELGIGVNCDGSSDICKQDFADTVLGGETGTEYLENVIAIAVGQTHAYALLASGEVVAWGSNAYGQIGDGTTVDKNVPVFVMKNGTERLSQIKMIAAGGHHGYALTNQGTVYAWGNNQVNQLGCGDSDTHLYPKLVIDANGTTISNIAAIDGGMQFGLMLTTNKTVYGLGAYKGTHLDKNGINYQTTTYAQLVLGGETPNTYLQNVSAISAGFSHSMAITTENGKNYVVSWGDNRFSDLFQTTGGQLGNNNTTLKQAFTPTYMRTSTGKITDVTKINAGCGVSLVETTILNKTAFYTCGCNKDGQLGFGDNGDRYVLTKLASVCPSYCSEFSYNADTTLCRPIFHTIELPCSVNSFDFKWYENDMLIPNTENNILVLRQGKYATTIIDKTNDCANRSATFNVYEKEADFQMINTSFCDDDITFKIIGEGTFNWYNKNGGYKLGSDYSITTPKSLCDEIIADSVYEIWVEHKNVCQPLPMRSVKKCDCNVTPPTTTGDELCYNREATLSAVGDSVVWYADSLLQYPIRLGNTYQTTYNEIGDVYFYATQIQNRCESKATPTLLSLYFCEPWYSISGTVIDNTDNPIENTIVYFYSNDALTATDSCTTDSEGKFKIFTHQTTGKILVKSPSSVLNDTWAGNKIEKENAYEFVVDADIKYVTITLLRFSTGCTTIEATTIWNNGKTAAIYSIDGKLLKTISIENQPFSILQTYKQPIIVLITNEDEEIHTLQIISHAN